MNIIDFHVHIFPDKIAMKAAKAVGKFYDIPMAMDGSLSTAIREMDRAGIGRFVAHSVATTPAQVHSINKFIMEAYAQYPERIIPFAAMHPDAENIPQLIDEIVAAGFKGIKIHPDIQGFQIDAPHVLDMISAIAGRLPLLIHTGDYRYDNSGPARMTHVMELFPDLVAICAHLGGYSEWENAAASPLPSNPHVYVDSSSSLFAVSPARAAEIIRTYGVEKVMFGTDYPMWCPYEELERIDALPLTAEEKEMILHKNAERLLGL